MTLLEIDEIKQRLDEKFLPLEPMLTGFRLVESEIADDALQKCESALGVRFPAPFTRLVKRYDFGHFTVGPIQFCQSGDYVGKLVAMNGMNQHLVPWWGTGARPQHHVLIAYSDPYGILLHTDTARVGAFDHESAWHLSEMIVARDFEAFVRGIGTVFIERAKGVDKARLGDETARAVDGSSGRSFWIHLAA
jgi:hypothetical protein